MSSALRRFLVVQTFLIWQGGFFIYAVVVVPIGTAVLESASLQGAITQRVTNWLNVIGLLSLVLLAWDQVEVRTFRRSRWIAWSFLAVTLAVQIGLHPSLDRMFDSELRSFADRPTFKFWHGVYLWAAVVQWVIGLMAVWFMLRAWHAESRSRL